MTRLGRTAVVLGLVLAASIPARGEDSWDLIRVGGIKIGSQHIQVERIVYEGRPLQRVMFNQVFSFRRGRDRTTMEVRYGSIETPEGAVLRLDARMKTGPQEVQTKGEIVDGKMDLTLSTGGQEQKLTIPWSDDIRGPYGVEMSLARNPIKPGESREVKTFSPVLNKIFTTKLHAVGREPIDMGTAGQKRDLIRVDETMVDTEGKAIPELAQTVWVEDSGQILRVFSDMLPGGLYTYRTTKAAAQTKNGDVDLTSLTTFRVRRRINEAERTREIRYQVTMKDDEPSVALPSDSRQSLTPNGPKSAILTVRTSTPGQGTQGSETASEEYLRPNPLINSADSEVVRLMRQAVGSKTDPWEKAVAIEDFVAKYIRDKNFSTAFASASEVARNPEGDCSEHGVLVAAMCRAAGIPARVAIGMVYVDSLGGFGMHLWNEVYIDRRWIAIDAAFNQSDVDAVHIKLSDSSLDGVSPFDAFAPVVRFLGKMTIEPVEVH